MKTWMRALFALAVLAAGATSQLSCSVNDYCLGCDNGDGGMGDGGGSGSDGGGMMDAIDAATCEPTNGGAEKCDGLDNDCNGLTDDGLLPEVGDLCSNQQGACAGALKQCINGKLIDNNAPNSTCTKVPAPETCDAIDNNCDGVADDGDPGGGAKCGTDLGECVAGQNHCNATTGMIECFGFIDHTGDAELCDAKDNDCDGNFDEGLSNLGNCGPTTNDGACVIGTLVCQGGSPVCTNAVFPKFETCNNTDDDCDNAIDEIFNKQTDIFNCGTCNMVCTAASKTCIDTTNNTDGTTCTMDSQCTGGTCATNSQPRCTSGLCGFQCNAGFQNLNGSTADGCEYRCFATGAEECDGDDNDCDGKTDEGLTAPAICLSGGECGATAPTATCEGMDGWLCTYPGTTQFPETLCDGLNNDCDANVDEAQPNLGDACSEVPETACTGAVDDDNDGYVNDGCPTVGTAESGTQCSDSVDSDSDGSVNDGCPAREERGVCKSVGTYICNPANLNGPATCEISTAGQAASAEACDAKDNDCDGQTDEGGNTGNLVGQDWVDLGDGRQMMKYEASKSDATATDPGTRTLACSRKDVQPWTNVTYPQALAACAAIGATLCTETQWHRACSVVTGPTYPVTVTTSLFIEAEDYQATTFAGAPETSCADSTDNDGDGRVNDGCPASGANETTCTGAVDNDTDGLVNDGCVSIGPNAWVQDYTAGFSGISAVEATPNLGGSIALAGALAQSPKLDYQITFGTASNNWHVWVKMFANSTANDSVHVGLNANAPTLTATATSLGTWHWVDAGALPGSVSGTQTVRLYMADDGTKIDKIYIINGATTSSTIVAAEMINPTGNKWAYATNALVYQPTTCNGDDLDTDGALAGDQDDILKTGSLTSCYAATGSNVFDMSGNVKEWTLAHAPDENPIRGGASNNTGEGISCPLNFTLADDNFYFPNIGFRCCR